MIEQSIDDALRISDPLERLAAFASIARDVEFVRSQVARQKEMGALLAVNAGTTQRDIAEACGVGPAMVQQWVKRGRALSAHEPF